MRSICLVLAFWASSSETAAQVPAGNGIPTVVSDVKAPELNSTMGGNRGRSKPPANPPPATPTIKPPEIIPTVPLVKGDKGDAGKDGLPGRDGKDAPPVDLTALFARFDSLQAQLDTLKAKPTPQPPDLSALMDRLTAIERQYAKQAADNSALQAQLAVILNRLQQSDPGYEYRLIPVTPTK